MTITATSLLVSMVVPDSVMSLQRRRNSPLSLDSSGLAALNIFSDSSGTWANAFGNTLRIEYLLMSNGLLEFAEGCMVDRSLDMSTGLRDNHFALLGTFKPLTG